MLYRQVSLRNGNTHMVTWLEMAKKFKEGDRITFKNDSTLWDVIKCYDVTREKSEIKKDWKVGGIA